MRTFITHDIPKISSVTLPNGTRTYQTPTGKKYPSVTTVTGLYNKKEILEWRERVGAEEANKISTRAASRGTRIHTLCENYLQDIEATPTIFLTELFNSIKPYLDKIDNIHALETGLYSDHLEVAGKVDCIAEYDGKISIIDFKTSTYPKEADKIKNYFMQMAAYAVAFEERTKIPVNRLCVIMAVENNDPIIFNEKRDNWVADFIELRKEYRRIYSI